MAYPSTSTPSSPTTSTIPSSPLEVPTHGPGGTFTVLACTTVAASPLEVLNLVRDTGTWPVWNSFCPRAEITGLGESGGELGDGEEGWLRKGSVATLDVFMGGEGLVEGRKRSRTQGIVITSLEKLGDSGNEWRGPHWMEGRKGYRIAWKSTGWSHWQLHSERVMEFWEVEINGKEATEYYCWETFGGVLGTVVKATVGSTLVDRFGDYARDVKAHLEGKGKATQ